MIVVGIGLYLGYVPFNAFLYERLISSFKYVSNIGFVIYVSDAFGYLGSLGVTFYKNFFSSQIRWIDFFSEAGLGLSVLGLRIFAMISGMTIAMEWRAAIAALAFCMVIGVAFGSYPAAKASKMTPIEALQRN